MESARTYTSVRTDVKQFKSVMIKQTEMVGKMEADALSRIKAQCINYLLRWLFGLDDEELNKYIFKNGQGMGGGNYMKITYTEEQYFAESEQTDFSTTGKVVCADGREIDFGLEISMSRSFESSFSATYEEMRAIDPLVINLDCNVANVSDQKFFFDLDADGNPDEISKPAFGTGFLALDRNNDGEISDGSELFGTKSGNGFVDLAEFDSDGNGWIDEADEIFDRLVIAYIKEDGTQELVKLKDADVGAIYTGSASTQFSINDPATNEEMARIRQTGIFLYESGMMGTIQHLDLAQ